MGFTLRVSVLENCQLRCNYCLPAKGNVFLPKTSWLSVRLYEKIALALAPLSIEKIRFTGGEPLLRPDLADIMNVFTKVLQPASCALTTNGLLFSGAKDKLIDAGLTSVTFHLDTLKEARYQELMGKGTVETVQNAVALAKSAGLKVKLNMVVQKHINDDELWDFLLWSKASSVQVRFIEQMNTGSAKGYVEKTFISGDEILDKISRHTKITMLGRKTLSAPAELFLAEQLDISFGLIASDTKPFCENCNRLRLSANGQLRTCLYEPVGHSLGLAAKDPPSDEELMAKIAAVVAKKTSFHPAMKKELSNFSMSQIGG